MTESNHQPEESDEAIDPLSATGMFLNAVRQNSGPSAVPALAMEAERLETLPPPPPRPTEVDLPPAESKSAEAGEFTRLFQNAQASPPTVHAEPQLPSTLGPTDFTRIFVPSPSTPLEAPSVEGEPTSRSVQVPKSARGFSSQGVSDTAAAEGGFTKHFRNDPRPQSAPADFQAFTPAPPAASVNSDPGGGFTQLFRELPSPPSPHKPHPIVASVNPPQPSPDSTGSGLTDLFQTTPSSGSSASRSGPLPANSFSPSSFPEAGEWPAKANFERDLHAAASAEISQSANDIFASLSSSDRQQPENRLQFDQPQAAPSPTFAHAPPHSTPSPAESESVTRLIQMLSPAAPQAAAIPSTHSTDQPQPWAKMGPGEYTRVISRESKAPSDAAVAAPSAQPNSGWGPNASMAMPGASLVPQIAKAEPPQVAAPKPSVAAAAGPMSKLQEILPILLVLNAFLMLVLIVVVIFSIQHR